MDDIKSRKRKISIYIKLLIYRFITSLAIISRPSGNAEKKLLIVKTDGVGDYILFRNFLPLLRDRFSEYHITLCGNYVNRQFAIDLDKQWVDQFIWLDHRKFVGNFIYRYKILKQIYLKNFTIAIQPRYSRSYGDAGDAIIKASKAKTRVGCSGDLSKSRFHKKNYNKYYTKIIYADRKTKFEFYRNKEFFDNLLQIDTNINKPLLQTNELTINEELPNKYIVLFPGAGKPFRCWPTKKFAQVASYLYSKYPHDIIIAGSKAETILGKEITLSTVCPNIIDLTGKLSLTELAILLSKANLLISNETAAVHMAAAQNIPTICISNGNHFGRFTPYPKEVFKEYYAIYPPEIMGNINDPVKLTNKYNKGSHLDISEIQVDDVIELVQTVLECKKL